MEVFRTEQDIKDFDWSSCDGFIAISPDSKESHYVTQEGSYNMSALPQLLEALLKIAAEPVGLVADKEIAIAAIAAATK